MMQPDPAPSPSTAFSRRGPAVLAILAAVLLAVAGLVAGDLLAARGDAQEPEPEGFELGGRAAEGRQVYADNCAMCHGANGDGQGQLKFDPPPRDLRDRDAWLTDSDWELYLVIQKGGPAVGLEPTMLAWEAQLSDQEIRDVAAWVKQLGEER